ncbi:hypothetical protein [Neorhodopirellula pilleata]|uniref:Uncharacterized protein n=1 Tax=Neorhodopirellula pilleata TaxID=2714738 RepID=A0A5C6AHQ7_9BACT|nr:hypothetical protein [Neorhodopirellula pilleata]TWT98788.1 hypothetical protein Pla100_19540 [Neorhodopirellula pilleata]
MSIAFANPIVTPLAPPPVENKSIRPSIVNSSKARPFSLDQELKVFGNWSDDPVWVPPKDCSVELAELMLAQKGWLKSTEARWERLVDSHRNQFTQVREIELTKASIRLPKGKLFVQITEEENFDKITDIVPACVQTRLEEFLAGPGKKKGVKVMYLKPLCVELDDQLYFTTGDSIAKTIRKIQSEVFSEYRMRFIPRRIQQASATSWNGLTALPRYLIRKAIQRRQKAIDAYQAKLEFERRKTALMALKAHEQCRTNEVSYGEMLALCNPLRREDVISQYSLEQELSQAKKKQLTMLAYGQLPWYAAFSMGLSTLGALVLTWTPPVVVCDPAFVAEFPDSPGTPRQQLSQSVFTPAKQTPRWFRLAVGRFCLLRQK